MPSSSKAADPDLPGVLQMARRVEGARPEVRWTADLWDTLPVTRAGLTGLPWVDMF